MEQFKMMTDLDWINDWVPKLKFLYTWSF